MTREQWNELAARCESAKGPDREIDWEIHVSIRYDGCGSYGSHPNYTGSLDATASRIGSDLLGASWRLHKIPTQNPSRATGTILLHYERRFEGDAVTPALALCAAFCRAMGEKAGE